MALAIPLPAARHAVRQLRSVERLLVAYGAVVLAVAIVRAEQDEACWWVALGHLLLMAAALLAARLPASPRAERLREAFPLVLLPALYAAVDVLTPRGTLPHDALVQVWEEALTGGQPSRDWWRAAPSAAWSTVLHAAYLAYYPLVAVPAAFFIAGANRSASRRYVHGVVLAFVACYVVFVLFPVAGPYYAFPRPGGPFTDNWAARAVYGTLASGSSYGAAFPSSHVAAAVAALGGTWMASRRAGMLMLVPVVLLVVATVYCQMHYVVDALAGLAVGAGAVWVAGRSALSAP